MAFFAVVSQSKYIRGLDGLRAVAVLLVLCGHAGVYARYLGPELDAALHPYLMPHVGLMMFFSLSGFLITLLLLRERARHGRIDVRRFLLRRVIRLFPALLAFLFIALGLALAGVLDIPPPSFAFAFAHLYNYVPRPYYSTTLGHLWSLALEEQFYLLWPLALRWGGPRGVPWWVGGAVLLSLSYPFFADHVYLFPDVAVVKGGQPVSLAALNLADVFFVSRWLPFQAHNLLLGCGAAWLVYYRPGWFFRLPLGWVLPATATALFLAPAAGLPYAVAALLQVTGLSALLIYLFEYQSAPLVRVLEWGPFVWLGRVSYGAYIWGGLFTTTAVITDGPWWRMLPWNVPLAILAGAVSYYLLERPLTALRARYRPAESIDPRNAAAIAP